MNYYQIAIQQSQFIIPSQFKLPLMKVLFKKVLSLEKNGAVCSLLLLDERVIILLDCGINQAFDFSHYRQIASQLKKVQIVLITHSGREYSGAYPFLISQLGLNPKIFYTTQPIMRYSPLNLHQEILNLGLPNYDKRVFNHIYSYYESMQLLKPKKKKQIDITSSFQNMPQSTKQLPSQLKKIQICCYLSGGTLCSIYWRITYGLINIVYLVQYNNYSLNHINGLNFDGLTGNSTDLLITDTYPRQLTIKSEHIYNQIKQVVLDFYRQNNIDSKEMVSFNPKNDKKLVFACNPNQLFIEVLSILYQIVDNYFQNKSFQKVGVVHYSKGLITLIKSQSQYFKPDFSRKLFKNDHIFQHSISLEQRISVCNVNMIKRVVSQVQNVKICYIGAENYLKKVGSSQQAVNNMKKFLIFKEDIQKIEKKFCELKLAPEQQQIQQEINQQIKSQIQKEFGIQNQDNDQRQNAQQQTGQKYTEKKFIEILQGIPRFSIVNKKAEEISCSGIRHHFSKEIKLAKSLNQCNSKQKKIKSEENIKMLNIQFDLPIRISNPNLKLQMLNYSSMSFHKTDFDSSCKIISIIHPRDIVFVNLPNNSQNIVAQYRKKLNDPKYSIQSTIYSSHTMPLCHFNYKNDLLEYEIDNLPKTQHHKKYQKVKGFIEKFGQHTRLHLDSASNEKDEFCVLRLQAKMRQNNYTCFLTSYGLIVQGIKIYRLGNKIVLEGPFSEQFLRIRKQLYTFFKLI